MGLLSKIVGAEQAAATAATTMAEPSPTVGGPPQAPPTACPTCHSPAFWLDVYGGGPHCRWCKPAPAASMVKAEVWLVESADPDDLDTPARLAEFAKGDEGSGNGGFPGMVEITGAASHPADPNDLESVTIDRRDAGGRCWTVLAERSRYGVLRMPDHLAEPSRRYDPPLGVAPVGDLLLEEWFEQLPEGLPGWPKSTAAVPPTSHVKGSHGSLGSQGYPGYPSG